MAVQNEIWVDSVVEALYDNNQFLRHLKNMDRYVIGGKVYHKPQSGGPSGVQKNRTVVPANVVRRNDTEMAEVIDEYTSNPTLIPHAETVELTYSKRMSVIRENVGELIEKIGDDMIYKLARRATAANRIAATGPNALATAPGATGQRTTVIGDDIFACQKLLDKQKVSRVGRYMLLDVEAKHQLMADEKLKYAFQQTIDLKTGIVGQLAGFTLLDRALVVRMANDFSVKDAFAANAATDLSGCLFWQMDHLERALGMTEMFDDNGNPVYFGDIYSFLIRMTGGAVREDGKGYGILHRAAA